MLNNLIKSELEEDAEKYGDDRKTEITDDDGDVQFEDLIPDEPAVVTISHEGFVKRMPVDTYRVQHRGGKGVSGGLRDEDFIEHFFVATTKSYLLCVTDKGQVYWLKVYEIPEGGRATRGKAIVNLLNNAIRFSPEGGQIVIGATEQGKHVTAWVQDHGMGIPIDKLQKVFEEFYQIEPPNTRRHGGLGIGLTIAKGIIEVQGGTIWAESEGLNKGTTVKVVLPKA